MRCTKSLSDATCKYDPRKTLEVNITSMLSALKEVGVTEVLSSHIYNNIPGFNWTDSEYKPYKGILESCTEKCEARGWKAIVISEPKEVQSVSGTKEVGEKEVVQEVPKEQVVLDIKENSVGVEWTPTFTETDLEMYSTDTGLQRIALMGSKCFGEYSSKAKQCDGCPLSGSCQVSSYAKIATFAAELDAQTLKDLTPTQVEAVEEKVIPTENSTTETPMKDGWKLMKDNVISSICSKCESVIPAGTDCINIRGQGNYHTGCAE